MKLEELIEQCGSELSLCDYTALRKPGLNLLGKKVDAAQMIIVDGIAEIPVGGILGINLGEYQRGGGMVDSSDISNEIDQAVSDPSVRKILFNFDSPGGMAAGTQEMADKIASIQKPKYAFSAGGLICSAAFWAAASCDLVMTTKTATVGSIGAQLTLYDTTARMAAMGVKVELITSGTLKGVGTPGTALTESGRALLQERVDELGAMFRAHVVSARKRPIAEADMQGQSFLAEKAKAKGLVDLIVRDKAQVMALLRG